MNRLIIDKLVNKIDIHRKGAEIRCIKQESGVDTYRDLILVRTLRHYAAEILTFYEVRHS